MLTKNAQIIQYYSTFVNPFSATGPIYRPGRFSEKCLWAEISARGLGALASTIKVSSGNLTYLKSILLCCLSILLRKFALSLHLFGNNQSRSRPTKLLKSSFLHCLLVILELLVCNDAIESPQLVLFLYSIYVRSKYN